jgi:hypothetical protein
MRERAGQVVRPAMIAIAAVCAGGAMIWTSGLLNGDRVPPPSRNAAVRPSNTQATALGFTTAASVLAETQSHAAIGPPPPASAGTLVGQPEMVAAAPIDALPPEGIDTTSPMGKGELEEKVRALLEQGEAHLTVGDVIGARMFFKKAADAGDAQAAIAMGATYDPELFATLKVRGMTPDADAARRWYQRAIELGSKDAYDRLERLKPR